jgi:ABC-type multidrug transport system fused ATPase/permease subunit
MVYVHGGDIRIGGRSIHSMDIRCVRRLFGVVPQFPYLFSGSLRSNLDRTGILSDPQLKDALQSVGLNYSLEHEVIEGGQNLSLGERQLLCLARVIAADRPVVLMDEPTSGLDPRTDARIHEILQDSLRGKTVLTIAHRRESLGNYDRVIEMQSGKVISSDWII